MIKDSKILITGGLGFLGGNLADKLSDVNLSNQIVILDNNTSQKTTGSQLKLDEKLNIKIIHESILSPILETIGLDFDYIIHSAGFLGIDKVQDEQLLNLDVNILGSRNIFKFATKQNKLKMLVTFSTSEIYGVNSDLSAETDDSVIKTIGKRWTYATSKLASEYYLKAFVQEHALKANIIRPFNVYGAYRYGSNAMTSMIHKAINNEDILISGDGSQIRAWCNIQDFVSGVLSLLSKDNINNEAFNIGDDRSAISILELAELIVKVLDSKSKIVILGNNIEDVKTRRPDITKAKQLLDYNPKVDLSKGISEVAGWIRKDSR